MKISWFLHKAIFDSRIDEMVDLIHARGDEAIVLDGRFINLPEPTINPTVGIVTLQVARRIHNDRRFSPGVFWKPLVFDQLSYLPYFGKWMLNDDIIYLPWAEFKRRGPKWLMNIAVNDAVFIRPNSGWKIFTGQTIGLSKFNEDCHALDSTTSVVAETIIGVCRPKSIDNQIEWRFWLGRDGVFSYSAYSWDDGVNLIDPPSIVLTLASEIATYCSDEINWTPDRLFVCDFCLSDGLPKLIEINSASCSGIYNADLNKIISGFVKAIDAEAL